MTGTSVLSLIGLLGAGFCVAAYVYGYAWRPTGKRYLHILSLFSTTVALAQLSLALRAGEQWAVNGRYAMAFLFISGLAQGLSAVQSRSPAECRRQPAEPPPAA